MKPKGGTKKILELLARGYKLEIKRAGSFNRDLGLNRAFLWKDGKKIRAVRYRHAVKAARALRERGVRAVQAVQPNPIEKVAP